MPSVRRVLLSAQIRRQHSPTWPPISLTYDVANTDAVDAIMVFYMVDTVRLAAPYQLRVDT